MEQVKQQIPTRKFLEHVDTSPKRMPSIVEDNDNIRPGMIIKIPSDEEGEFNANEYGSNTERVRNLERQFGPYLMIS